MKKLLSLAITACMVLAMAACSSQPNSSASTPSSGSSSVSSGSAAPTVNYPTKTIKLICPWSAGGGSDQICRAVATVAEKYLGQPIVVENRDGSGGVIGITEASRAANDGYTMVLATTGVFLTQPILTDVTYKLDSFEGVAKISTDEICIVVSADCPANNIAELAELYQGKQLNATGNAAGSLMELLSYDVYDQAGIDVNMVQFSGGASECISALLGGHIEAIAVHPYEVKSNVEGGTLKILGVTGSSPLDWSPNTQTFADQNIDTLFNVQKAFFVPAGTDQAVLDTLTAAFEKIYADPDFIKLAENMSLNLTPLYGSDVTAAYQEQIDACYDKAVSLIG